MRYVEHPGGLIPTARLTGIDDGRLLADYPDLVALADIYEREAVRLVGWSGLGARIVADGDLAASAVLSPLTFAEAEAAVGRASADLAAHAAGWEGDALGIRTALAGYELADRAAAQAAQDAAFALGVRLGLLPATVAGAAGWAVWQQLPDGTRADVLDAAGDFLAHHPGLTQDLVGAVPSLLAGAVATTPYVGVAASEAIQQGGLPLLTGLASYGYGAETGERTQRRPGLAVADTYRQPHDVADVVEHLGELSDLSDAAHPENNGTIEVQRLTHADGSRSWIVYLPGTDDMDPFDGTDDSDVRDMAENLRLLGGRPSAYTDGILDAMGQAGIAPDEPVMLAGHSQGGMAAEAIAASGSGFDVTQVVTAGAPAVPEPLPTTVHALQLEHDGDLVPTLDGRDNDTSAQHVTVSFDSGVDDVVTNHDFDHYTRGAEAVDASADPALLSQLAGMYAEGFLGDGTDRVDGEIFQITRTHGGAG